MTTRFCMLCDQTEKDCRANNCGRGADFAPIRHFLNGIDWKLLGEQKLWLICFDDDGDEDTARDADKAQGILNLIDALQDAAVAAGIPEATVFPERGDGVAELRKALATHAFTPYADERFPDLKPLEGDDGFRVELALDDADIAKIKRGKDWSAIVTDRTTGRTFKVEGAPCSIDTCYCAARVVEEVDK